MKSLLVLAIVCVCGCGARRADPLVEEVNALVPAKHKEDLVFVMREVEEHQAMPSIQTWRVPAPRSWDVSADGGRIAPRTNAANGGSGVSRLGSHIKLWTERCEGECVPPTRLTGKFVLSDHDEDLQVGGRALHRRVQVWSAQVPGDDAVNITVVIWPAAGPVVRECSVRLEPALQDAVKAFEAACTQATES